MKQDRFCFVPLGGSGEIGMNMNLFGYGPEGREKWIMVDCGVTFGGHETPGVDIIMPDHAFIAERKKNLLAIILTHAHEDHIGAIAYLWPDLKAPIYATPFTARLTEEKFKDRGVRVDKFLNTIPLGAKLLIGDFKVEYVAVTHSIPEPNGLLIETPLGRIYHTGDWKFDDNPVIGDVTDFARLQQIADDGVDAVICDSTNAPDPGVSGSEAGILEPLTKAIAEAKGKVAVTTFASNAARMKTIMRALADCGRSYVLCGRSVERIFRVGREMNYFGGIPEPIGFEDSQKLPRNKVAYICTGSQGEPRSALSRIAQGSHPFLNLTGGDTVIFSSKTIPGNEKEVGGLLNALAGKGIKVITSKDIKIHVSGHPCADELRSLYRLLMPKTAIPVHGEERHMQIHAAIAAEVGVQETIIPHNGDVITLAPGRARISGQVPYGRLYVDGYVIDDEEFGACAQRKKLNYAGYCNVFLTLNGAGKLAAEPVISAYGVPEIQTQSRLTLKEILTQTVKEAFGKLEPGDFETEEGVKEEIRTAVRKKINALWGKKPITDVFITHMNGGGGLKIRHTAKPVTVSKPIRQEDDFSGRERGTRASGGGERGAIKRRPSAGPGTSKPGFDQRSENGGNPAEKSSGRRRRKRKPPVSPQSS